MFGMKEALMKDIENLLETEEIHIKNIENKGCFLSIHSRMKKEISMCPKCSKSTTTLFVPDTG